MRRNETENTVQYNGREISVDMILRASEDCMKGYTTSCDKCFLLNIDSNKYCIDILIELLMSSVYHFRNMYVGQLLRNNCLKAENSVLKRKANDNAALGLKAAERYFRGERRKIKMEEENDGRENVRE